MEKISLVEHKNTKAINKPAKANKPKRSFAEIIKGFKWWQWAITAAIGLLIILGTATAVVATNYLKMAKQMQAGAEVVKAEANAAYDAFKAQNLPQTAVKLTDTRTALQDLQTQYQSFNGLRGFPGARAYFEDGDRLFNAGFAALTAADQAIATITPYADMLGFGEDKEEGDGTTQDRITKLLTMLSVVGPGLDEILASLEVANNEIHAIDAQKYPATVADIPFAKSYLKKNGKTELAETPVKDNIILVQDGLQTAVDTFREYRPVIEKIPAMAGGEGERMKYLVIFQNNNELRPTGGFLTAYSIINVENGQVMPEKSDDIYEMDKKFTKQISIPDKLGKYLTTETTWHLRDMNISPDLKVSMDEFLPNYQTVKGEPQDIDGIIVLDTFVLTGLMDVVGPIEVPGYGTFTTQPDAKYNVPEVIVALSEIITRPTPYIREDRKGILGPMMQTLLSKVYTAPKQSFPDLFQVMLASLEGRHVQVYYLDEELQSAAEKINIAGRMVAPTDKSDFIGIVDANLGGAKSNLFITYDVEQTIGVPENNTLEKNVVITYKNSRPGDNCNLEAGLLCLNATNNDWHRLYLPLGSKLISAKGFKSEPEVYDENGFTVVDGFFSLSPNSTAKVEINYTVPYGSTTDYVLNIWKQGGVDEVKHLIDVNDNQEEIVVTGDTVYKTKF